MNQVRVATGLLIIGFTMAADAQIAQPRNARTAAPAVTVQAPTPSEVDARAALIKQYCVGCHNDTLKTGGLSLAAFDLNQVHSNRRVAEKVIRKLRAGLMPPSGARRPDAASLQGLRTFVERQIDDASTASAPGRRPFQRLTRTEYARAIRDLLDLEVDVTALLPPDSLSDGFDNVADSQSLSPALVEGYLRAASRIAGEALGDPQAEPGSATFKVARTTNQLRHVDGTPLGTRGGISVVHNLPADGDYSFKVEFYDSPEGVLFGRYFAGEQMEISVNKERVAFKDIPPGISEANPEGLAVLFGPVPLKAGRQTISAAFIQRGSLLMDDLIAPIGYTLVDATVGNDTFLTTMPHVKSLEIVGPFHVTGVSDTPSRRKVLICRPASASEELPCARQIISNIARQAFRRPVTAEDTAPFLSVYKLGREHATFEAGIRAALESVLASPYFVFRFEYVPANAKAGQSYRLSDLDLASRLSFFLWSTLPDAELLTVAGKGQLKDPAVFEKQVRRMLADPRSETLATKFAGQWLRLGDLANIHPDPLLYPNFDDSLARSMRRETELLFDSVVREDRDVLDLMNADYTFVDELLAKHYSIPNVAGSRFRRVHIDDPNRQGLLGQASILTLTSHVDRTSPVLRGKWMLEVLLGTPPPPPPPNVPELTQTAAIAKGRTLSVRERMEMHRASPACSSCHRLIDPLGLSLENFDVTGRWRIRDGSDAVNADTVLFDGTKLEGPAAGPAALRRALLNYPDAFVGTFTEKLLVYALGRRVEDEDMPMVRSIMRTAKSDNYRFSSLVLALVKSPAFQMSVVETETARARGQVVKNH